MTEIDTASLPIARTNRLSTILVIASGVVAALQVGKAAIAIPALRTDFHLNLQQAGWVMSIFALLAVVGGIPVGAATTRFGDRNLLVAGLFAIAAGSAIGASTETFGILLAARILEGTGLLLVVISGSAILNRVATKQDRDLVFAFWSCYMPAGMALALLLGIAIDGWRVFWFANAAVASLFAVLVHILVPRERSQSAPATFAIIAENARKTLTSAGPLLLALMFAMYGLQFFALFSFLPVLLVERIGVSHATAGVMSAFAIAANIAGNIGAGVALRRGVPRALLLAGASAVMTVTGIAVFILPAPTWVIFGLCVIFSGVGGCLPSAMMGAAPRAVPEPHLAAMSVGLVMQGSNLGQMIGPVVVGSLVDRGGWTMAAVPVAIAGGIAIATAFALQGVFRRFTL
ncbi:MFS transporter [Phyllobacterium myrsinacearum]|uniref:Putative MFS family arabinose efflux permease n=1 Tax=Phyllobacterium myrsinacearum TaxID=28101 RepID=A0A839EU91_9HYPH|nr:putative MFS family arabinose efflux permease [Phyllobacterium myrsinacearum]